MGVTVEELIVGDPPEAWAGAGFAVDGDEVRIGGIRVRLVGRDHGKGLLGWRLAGADPAGLDQAQAGETVAAASTPVPATTLDGLPTEVGPEAVPCTPGRHPNRATAIDHIVVLTPDGDRTRAALEGLGLRAKRSRPTDTYGMPMVQTFFRAGETIIELVGPEDPMPEGEPGFFGLAHVVDDLDATAALLGDGLGRTKDAVQPGRRITTLRHRDLGMSVATAFMSA